MRLFVTKLLALLLVAPALAAEQQVPFGDVVSENITNYHRHTPGLATSGKLLEGAAVELQSHGFATVIDLREAEEGVAAEQQLVTAEGMRYVNLPVGKEWPDAEVIDRFSALMEDTVSHPLLLHCGSGNRAAVVWAAYRQRQGINYEQVLLEARTIGLKPKREPQLRAQFEVQANPEAKPGT